ncbi:MAG: HTH domain-containing protein [Cyanobacteria bacterium P01_F01_bin.13]
MEKKKTIAQVAIDILKEAQSPMTAAEITQIIQEKNLYTFNAKNPRQIVRSAIERRCDGEGKKRTVSPAWFTKLPNKQYALKQEVG